MSVENVPGMTTYPHTLQINNKHILLKC